MVSGVVVSIRCRPVANIFTTAFGFVPPSCMRSRLKPELKRKPVSRATSVVAAVVLRGAALISGSVFRSLHRISSALSSNWTVSVGEVPLAISQMT